ncbi:hypothetical protein [Thalassomonas haliotis]|uniref:Uncharacterized protein n=1 Tax=Thalassomonas haliotis TaxID=485448 RepID=A0ABY7VBQ6_9GAMM|nr:hypothetical protein [Thalassomonas haliotis]WDE10746.1 hypothetical protein H3N35_21240 [Thalassomonas haliotis]
MYWLFSSLASFSGLDGQISQAEGQAAGSGKKKAADKNCGGSVAIRPGLFPVNV